MDPGPNRRLDVITRQLTRASISEPELLLQQGEATELARVCPKALHAVLLHDNGQLRSSVYDFLRVSSSCLQQQQQQCELFVVGSEHSSTRLLLWGFTRPSAAAVHRLAASLPGLHALKGFGALGGDGGVVQQAVLSHVAAASTVGRVCP
jgi:hypothetical protein